MRKFAAHYVLTETGELLKNGLAEVAPNGTIRFIDTHGELAETERMIFHSGLLMKGFEYVKNQELTPSQHVPADHPLPLLNQANQSDHLSLAQVIELAQQLQSELPGHSLIEILSLIDRILLSGHRYVKSPVPGLFLITLLDLSTLRFKSISRLKKII